MRNVMTVVGIRRKEYTTKDNLLIKGYTVYLTYEDDNVRGMACTNVFLSERKLTDPIEVGDQVIVRYNKYGKVDSLDMV